MKQWSRAWKVRLILDMNPNWTDLYEELVRLRVMPDLVAGFYAEPLRLPSLGCPRRRGGGSRD